MVGEIVDKALYLDNIEEYIYDEGKVCTYKWLSQTLGVHVNIAKHLLYEFSLRQRRKNDLDLNITYFLSGIKARADGTKGIRCKVVTEDDLEIEKSLLDNVNSCHIYSIQLARLENTDPLYMTDYELIKNNLNTYNDYGAISHCTVTMAPSKLPSQDVHMEDNLQNGRSDKGFKESPSECIEKIRQPTGAKSLTSHDKSNKVGTKSKSSGATVKKSTNTNSKSSNKNQSAKLLGMFENAAKRVEASDVSHNKVIDSPSILQSEREDIMTLDSSTREKTPECDPVKKRRRIRTMETSSDEEMDSDSKKMLSSDVEPKSIPTEDAESKKPDSVERTEQTEKDEGVAVKKRKRVQRLVPKTFVDDDGYMVTEKVWETESTDASETEEPPPKCPLVGKEKNKKPEIKSPPKTASTNKQQKSIMSFFKKK